MSKVGMLTTWGSRCGIFEYSRNLRKYLDFDVYSNTNGFFGVAWWGEQVKFEVDKLVEAATGLDVFQVQYHSSLYKHPEFMNAIKQLKGKVGKLVVTLHDSSRHPGTDLNYFDDVIYHKQGILHEKIRGNGWLLPYPVQNRIPVVFSFGMGDRNDYDLIRVVCNGIGAKFDYHDSRKHGWLAEEELFDRMKSADAIVLWYDEVYPLVGASAAARTAIASFRPVITNCVSWFSDLGEREVHKAVDKEELRKKLLSILKLNYIAADSFEELALKHKEIYNGAQ